MSAATTVRRASSRDARIIAAHNVAMAAESERRTLDPATVLAGVRRALDDPARGTYYVAERGGRLVGQLLVTREWSDWRDAWFWWIQSVYVEPDARRQGVYRLLHEHVLAAAREGGEVCGLRLYVEAGNRGAQHVYEQMGMTPTGYLLFEVALGDESRAAPSPGA